MKNDYKGKVLRKERFVPVLRQKGKAPVVEYVETLISL